MLTGDGLLIGRYDGDTRMPAGARDTGYHYRHWRLWLTADRASVYVRTPDGVEERPRVREGAGRD
ncbi:hypothetical protein QQY24_03635 [Streptomyces sp. TG1A-8]|uniref:hypothetical protein n=1 Tax=Streptomyces sp. TG1A-8 TaxID=3051385 RepID=UPI00265BE27F|nr:hypothetical protein [Streptomyces sp. TG1A-8]MDO0924552.1 hypothetical protein [Streptomyces sp. TG1A-8]